MRLLLSSGRGDSFGRRDDESIRVVSQISFDIPGRRMADYAGSCPLHVASAQALGCSYSARQTLLDTVRMHADSLFWHDSHLREDDVCSVFVKRQLSQPP